MRDRYLVLLAYHADNPGDLSPSDADLAQHEQTLAARYDGPIRKRLAGQPLDPAELRYVAARFEAGRPAEQLNREHPAAARHGPYVQEAATPEAAPPRA